MNAVVVEAESMPNPSWDNWGAFRNRQGPIELFRVVTIEWKRYYLESKFDSELEPLAPGVGGEGVRALLARVR